MLALKERLRRAAHRVPQARIVRRFVRREDGATAVEFSIVVLPFLALSFAIIETALVFFAGQVLETATADSARLIMTGQAQLQSWDQAAFKQKVCERIYGLFDCDGGVQVDVRTYSSFVGADLSRPVDADGNINVIYQPGEPGDVVVVRLLYQWPLLLPSIGINLADMNGNKRLLVATAAFRNEPYK